MMTILTDNPSTVDVLVVFAWIGFIALIFVKQQWFFNFDERFPKLQVFDLMIYTDAHKFIFLVGRLVVFSVVLYVLGTIIRLIF